MGCWFPKIGGFFTPKSSILIGVSIIFTIQKLVDFCTPPKWMVKIMEKKTTKIDKIGENNGKKNLYFNG